LLIISFVSCSKLRTVENLEDAPEMISLLEPHWFSDGEEHSLKNSDGEPSIHLFYDAKPAFSKNKKFVNTLIITPAGSEEIYDLDILSGQKYFSKKNCPEFKLPFSIGYIPRTLDQLGTPQKVIIFGDEKKIHNRPEYSFFRVKLLGGYTERVCPRESCTDNSSWITRLVFIGVDFQDAVHSKMNDLDQFHAAYSWPEIKKNLIKIADFKHDKLDQSSNVQIGEPFDLEKGFDFFKRNSIHLSLKELSAVKKNCHSLYDKLWNDVGVEREEDLPAKNIEELKKKVKKIKELESQGIKVGFAKRLHEFTKVNFDSIVTCSKFVYAGNLQKNKDKFWFLSFMNFFYHLHKVGYFFDCPRNNWQRNSFNGQGELNYEIKSGLQVCHEENIDKAMDYLVSSFLQKLKGQNREYYRFIDYDNHQKGTHKKIYSWVKMKPGEFTCDGEKDQNGVYQTNKSGLILFPEDIKWNLRKKMDLATQDKIIY